MEGGDTLKFGSGGASGGRMLGRAVRHAFGEMIAVKGG